MINFNNKNQKGFSPLLTIIVAGVFVILGGLAFYINRTGIPPGAEQSKIEETNAAKTKAGEERLKTALSETEIKSQNRLHIATLETNKGVIKFATFDADAPKTVNNFITLAQRGFYNGIIFHRIVKGFVIQGGDPNCADNSTNDKGPCGAGGPGYKFEDELNPNTNSGKEGYKKGVVAMANSGPNTNGSQFFIMLADNPLPHKYSIFGKVIEGQEVVDAIGAVGVSDQSRPLTPVVIKRVIVDKVQ